MKITIWNTTLKFKYTSNKRTRGGFCTLMPVFQYSSLAFQNQHFPVYHSLTSYLGTPTHTHTHREVFGAGKTTFLLKVVQPWTLLNTFHWSFAGSSAPVDTLKHFHWSFGHYKPPYEALHFTTRAAPLPSWPAWLLALVLVLHPLARSLPCTQVHSRGITKNYCCLNRWSTYGSNIPPSGSQALWRHLLPLAFTRRRPGTLLPMVFFQLAHMSLLYNHSSLGVCKLYNIWLQKLADYHWLGPLKP